MMAFERDRDLFAVIPPSTLAGRLIRAVRGLAAELRGGPGSYLQVAFSLDNGNHWVAVRLLRDVRDVAAEFARHPIRFISNGRDRESATVIALNGSTLSSSEFLDGRFVASAVSSKPVVTARRRSLRPVLAISGAVHSVLILYIIYVAIVSPYVGIRVVNKAYRPFDPTMLGPLVYPPGMLHQQRVDKVLTLEEIQEKARKHAEEIAKQREKAEKDRLEREKAEREKAERERQVAEQKAAEEKKAADAKQGTAFEFNETALKDVVGKIYTLYQAGGLDIDVNNFSVMLGFRIEPDGSLSHLRTLKSSGSKEVDRKAGDVLWTIGESHALGPLSTLSSNSIRLDLTDKIARLTITGFAPTPDEAKKKESELNALFFMLRLTQKSKNPDVAELLSMAKVRSVNNRIDTDLTMSRTRAAELMRAKFGNNAASNP